VSFATLSQMVARRYVNVNEVLVSASLMRRPSARLAQGVRGHRIICSAVNINGPDEQIQIDLLRLRPAAARRFGAAL
jgi:hypothetical protein